MHAYESCSGRTYAINRRDWLSRFGLGLGTLALGDLMARDGFAAPRIDHGILGTPHFPARAKRVIFLFQSGGPSHLETFDYKPTLNQRQGQQLPDSVRQGQRLTGMSAFQTAIPLAGSAFKFFQYGNCGAWFSELLPHMATVADELCFIKSLIGILISRSLPGRIPHSRGACVQRRLQPSLYTRTPGMRDSSW